MKEETNKIIAEWKGKSNDDLSSIRQFLSLIQKPGSNIRFEDILDAHTDIFSKFDCLLCANCCKTTPPIFTNRDVKRIAQYLGTTPRQFKRKYTIEDINGELIGIKVPCSFLNDDHSCSIYEVRPEACITYPHTDDPEYNSRAELNYNNTLVCPAAYAIVKMLSAE